MRQPLDGVLVVAVEQAVAAPFCTSRLADSGARVIKVERPGGDFAREYDHAVNGDSAYFVWLNRGKESVCLDIKDAGDAKLLRRMIERADVFIQNLAPGACSRAGFGSADLRKRHARLITVDISGYGETGAYRDMKAYDLLVQCESGLASITGAAAEPGRVGVSVCDVACGMYAHAAVLQALIERTQTGNGQSIHVSLFDAIADWMTVPLLQYQYGGAAPKRVGLNHPSIAPYGAYACADGTSVVIAIQNEREWQSFCAKVLRRPGLARQAGFRSNVERCANRESLNATIAQAFGRMARSKLVERLRDGHIAFVALNSVADFARHEQLSRVQVPAPGGPVALVAPPARIAGRVPALDAVPALDEHGAALRAEFSAPAILPPTGVT